MRHYAVKSTDIFWPAFRLIGFFVLMGFFMTTANAQKKSVEETLCAWQVVNEYEHDPDAFTQGLLMNEGRLYEGTGLYGESTLREVDLATGKTLRQIELDEKFFGEGIAIVEDRIFQLTWREQKVFVYLKEDFTPIDEFTYPGEGWGLTFDGQSLIMSDGTPEIRFLNPKDFSEERRITVRSSRGLIANLNELEFVDGAIFANIWQTSVVAKIAPANGQVLSWIDLRELTARLGTGPVPGVLNGIAWRPGKNRFLLTGKNWPRLFELEISCGP